MARKKVERKLREAAERVAVQQLENSAASADGTVAAQPLPSPAAEVGATAIVVSGVPVADSPAPESV